ncbi:MAG: peptide deformylase [Chloroflexi bacterium]|nr:peptide deformylase [Chloroflexota bacterium]
MGVRPILALNQAETTLRRKAVKVRVIDRAIQRLIDDMIETMYAAPGVGLAAPQVGVSLRVIVLGMPGEPAAALINPELVKATGRRQVEEGCLSIPGYLGELDRADQVIVKGKDRRGKQVRWRATELLAQALQHEIDHLNGVLYVDHLPSLDSLRRITPAESALEPE